MDRTANHSDRDSAAWRPDASADGFAPQGHAEIFVARLADALEGDGRAAKDVSIAAGLSAGFISDLRRGGRGGKKSCSVAAAAAIAAALGVSLDWLTGLSDADAMSADNSNSGADVPPAALDRVGGDGVSPSELTRR